MTVQFLLDEHYAEVIAAALRSTGRGDRTAELVTALRTWLDQPEATRRPVEDWLI
ncbi:hypothetical protein [Salinibacterium sp.]|uniref:hypothetical protein n=1 Tax=Salinibacterium sp. TaxID=1915057 RepID=UPI00286C3FF9|nr:hypothetical protein [Salinibacterium sp.]